MAAFSAEEGPDGLAFGIHEALPDITDSCFSSLMKVFAELGVKSPEDAIMLAEPHVLVKILGEDQAKKLVAYFNEHSTSVGWIVTDGAWDTDQDAPRVNNQYRRQLPEWCMLLLQALVNAMPQISAASNKMSASLNQARETQKRAEDTFRTTNERLAQAKRVYADRQEELNRIRSRSRQAEEERHRELQEENERFAKAMEEARQKRKLQDEGMFRRYFKSKPDQEQEKGRKSEGEREREQRGKGKETSSQKEKGNGNRGWSLKLTLN